MDERWVGIVAASVAVVVAYLVAGYVRDSYNVLKIVRGVHPRASLSKLQLFFFTLVVLWVVVAVLTWTGELTGLSSDVVVLLGIGAAGTAGGKMAGVAKRRLDSANWAWLVRKGWIKESVERGTDDRNPEFGDLLRSDGEFDVGKFQLFAFSLVVGAALVYFAIDHGAAAACVPFVIPGEYLALLGLSEVAYVGGKAVQPGTRSDLDKKVTELREKERAFVEAVEKAWTDLDAGAERNLAAARAAAPEAYQAYRMRALEAAGMVAACTGNAVDEARIEPDVPAAD